VDFTSVSQYAPGTPVEVRTRYLSNWTSGFEVVSIDGDRVGLRRQSDSVILPVKVAATDVRPRRSPPEQP
jgi:hypothetical protein